MTGYTKDVKDFDNWITCNYTMLQKHCRRYRISDDSLNDVYLNVRDRIFRSGMTQQYYTTYVKRSLRNLQINEGKKLKGKFYVDFDCPDYNNTVEQVLQENNEEEKDTQLYREEIMYFSKMIFKFIMTENRYSEEWQFVFRCYYLMPGRMTYAKLNQMTGINKNQNTKIIQTMKKDIRTNFLQWLKKQEDGRPGDN